MQIAMIPLLSELEERPLDERPVLYACKRGNLTELSQHEITQRGLECLFTVSGISDEQSSLRYARHAEKHRQPCLDLALN